MSLWPSMFDRSAFLVELFVEIRRSTDERRTFNAIGTVKIFISLNFFIDPSMFSRDLFLSSKMEPNPPVQSSSYRPNVNDWNVADDFHPLNLTDNDLLDDRRSNHDDEPEETYLTAFHQLLQTQHDLINHQVHEPENMLSTILEASCEEATPMTSLVDVHQTNNVEEEEEEISEDEATERPMNPPSSIDDVPVLTVFSKNESEWYRSGKSPITVEFFLIRFEIQRLCSTKIAKRG